MESSSKSSISSGYEIIMHIVLIICYVNCGFLLKTFLWFIEIVDIISIIHSLMCFDNSGFNKTFSLDKKLEIY